MENTPTSNCGFKWGFVVDEPNRAYVRLLAFTAEEQAKDEPEPHVTVTINVATKEKAEEMLNIFEELSEKIRKHHGL